jgi:hypothetical protein
MIAAARVAFVSFLRPDDALAAHHGLLAPTVPHQED